MKYVIDSSVAFKWVVPEVDTPKAQHIRIEPAFEISFHRAAVVASLTTLLEPGSMTGPISIVHIESAAIQRKSSMGGLLRDLY